MESELYQSYEKAATQTDRVNGFMTMLRESQRYGLMMVPTSRSRDHETSIRLVALMLLQQVNPDYTPATGIPLDWTPRIGTLLREDADSLVRLFEGQQESLASFWSVGGTAVSWTQTELLREINVKHLIEVVSNQVEAKARPLRTVAVTNLVIGMVVGGLSVSAVSDLIGGRLEQAVGFSTVAIGLIWFGIHRAFKC